MKSYKVILWIALKQFLQQLYHDSMLFLICIAPFLCGVFFKYLLPFIAYSVKEYIALSEILLPYHLIFDLILLSITPMLYCFAAAYVILSEIDDNITRYMAVTPLGKSGYLISRIGLPAFIALLISLLIYIFFHIEGLRFTLLLPVAILSTLVGVISAMLIVSLSNNKVEGMAISKLSGLCFLGIPAPFFLKDNLVYGFGILPSFWISKFAIERNYLYALIGFVIALAWIGALYHRFERKIN